MFDTRMRASVGKTNINWDGSFYESIVLLRSIMLKFHIETKGRETEQQDPVKQNSLTRKYQHSEDIWGEDA